MTADSNEVPHYFFDRIPRKPAQSLLVDFAQLKHLRDVAMLPPPQIVDFSKLPPLPPQVVNMPAIDFAKMPAINLPPLPPLMPAGGFTPCFPMPTIDLETINKLLESAKAGQALRAANSLIAAQEECEDLEPPEGLRIRKHTAIPGYCDHCGYNAVLVALPERVEWHCKTDRRVLAWVTRKTLLRDKVFGEVVRKLMDEQ